MRILITADPMLPVPPQLYGGIERIIDSLVGGLQDRGHNVGLLAHRDSHCCASASFPWPEHARAVAHMRTLRDAARSFVPDVVHSFSRLAYLAYILPQKDLPKVMSFQREPTSRTVKWANRVARRSLTFTGCSDYISNKGRTAAGIWHTIHNFVDLERYSFISSVADNAPLVFLSRLEPIKGPHLAIEAAKKAGRRLVIAGNHSERDDVEGCYWRETIKPQIDGCEIEYVGEVNDAQKNELLGRAAALIVPVQWNEPFGIVFAEALACGTPVISCPRGALPEIVSDGREGFLVETAAELAAAVERLGTVSRATCRARCEEHFSASAVVPRYETLYEQLIHR